MGCDPSQAVLAMNVFGQRRVLKGAHVHRFEVHFVGAEASVDMMASGDWLRSATSAWPWPIHIRVNADRAEALEVLAAPGTLLVLCSLVDNMPYVVAEAAVRNSLLLAPS